ncbi:hypothetical protein DWW99_13630 [[Clostridium] leptum]|nr:hypothetical protein DWW99_13630 [[Clostridium] leptum]
MRNKAVFFIASPASQAGTARGQRPGAFYFPVPSIYQFFYFLLLLGRGLFSGLFPLFILNGLCYNKEE